MTRAARWPTRLAVFVAAAALFVALAHVLVVVATRIEPPAVALPEAPLERRADGVARVGESYAMRRGRIWQVGLAGAPEAIGAAHARLLRDDVVRVEGDVLGQFDAHVPRFAQPLVLDVARLRFSAIGDRIAEARRRELGAEALALAPDPFAALLPTYERMIYLTAIYDVALSFEGAPLVGCSSLAVSGERAAGGHALLARNFDLEAGRLLDEDKAVFFVREAGRIAYASVAWPGFVGAVSGMNAAGLALVVHGARAGSIDASGEPLALTMRDVLGSARDVDAALRVFADRAPIVSHLVFLADASGELAIVERVPGSPPFARRARGAATLTNHLEGPSAADPKNERIRAATTTLARKARLDELMATRPVASPADLAGALRDRAAAGGASLPAGDRRAIDAEIATHAVIFDATARVLWVNEGPHLGGRFLRFDVARALADGYSPESASPVEALDEASAR